MAFEKFEGVLRVEITVFKIKAHDYANGNMVLTIGIHY